MLDLLMEPLGYAFMRHGLVAAMLVGAVCAVVGTYVVLRGLAFFGDALAHAVLPGVAVGYLASGGAQGQLFWWGLATALATALGIGAVSRSAQIKEDTAIGIIFAGMFALGIALISTMRSYAVDLTHLLFGNVLGVGAEDLLLIGVFSAAVLLVVALFYKEFLVLTFDPVLAATLRLPVGLLNNLLLVLMAVCVVVALQTVGIALMVAMLVTPAATAYLLTRRFGVMMALAAGIGALSGAAGLYLSYYFNMASGAAIVLVCTGFFALAFLFSPRRGLIHRLRR